MMANKVSVTVAVLAMALGGCATMQKVTTGPTAPPEGTKLAEIVDPGFKPGKAKLTGEGRGKLDDVVKVMQAHPELRVAVEGHTDASGGEAYNKSLSERRARLVAEQLFEHGIVASRVSVRGYGESRPIADNKTAEGRSRNRRVEIVVVQ
jgi:outer membrane protein OmpA-like peptidoglycan-associated protein